MSREEIDQLHIDYMKKVENGEDVPPRVPMASEFVDARGRIANLIYGKFDSAALIESKAGTTRSNHKHPDYHLLIVVNPGGEMHYWERKDGEVGPTEPTIYRYLEPVYTAPGMIHKTYFPVNTVIISFNSSVRTEKNHEAQLTRVEF